MTAPSLHPPPHTHTHLQNRSTDLLHGVNLWIKEPGKNTQMSFGWTRDSDGDGEEMEGKSYYIHGYGGRQAFSSKLKKKKIRKSLSSVVHPCFPTQGPLEDSSLISSALVSLLLFFPRGQYQLTSLDSILQKHKEEGLQCH